VNKRLPSPVGLSPRYEEPLGTAVPDTAMTDVRPRTFRLLVKMLAGIRLVQLLPWPLAFALGVRFDAPHIGLAIAGFGLQAGWSLFYAAWALRKGTLPNWLMALDIAVT